MVKLTDKELDGIYGSLTSDQKNVLDFHVKRGMKTKWLNVWAKKLGNVLTSEDLLHPDKSMEKLLEWILLDYEDNLIRDGTIRCECGRSLRYRYTIKHKTTHKIYKLGRIHFEQHTGLSPEMVSLITKGLKEIDLEREEILTKVRNNWKIPFSIPDNFKMPSDLVEQINNKLPLLDRQLKQLKGLIDDYNRNQKLDTAKQLLSINNYKKEQKINPPKQEQNQDNWQRRQHELDEQKLLNTDPKVIYGKLMNSKISAQEARCLYLLVRDNSFILSKSNIKIQEVKKYVKIALGRISDPNIRNWLVEIECL